MAIVIGYFIEGPALTILYSISFILVVIPFIMLRMNKTNYDKAVIIFLLAPTIMITFALFMSQNNFTRVVIPLFPILVGYLFLHKRYALYIAIYAVILIITTLFLDMGLVAQDWISTLLLIMMIIFIFNFYHDQHAENMKALYEMNHELKRVTLTDKLTKLYNRRGLDEAFSSELNRFHRFDRPLGIIIIDIDHFKRVNDTFGHLYGDEILVQLAQVLKSAIRDTDIVGRWGGEEFLVICPETTIEGTRTLSQKLHRAVKEMQCDKIDTLTVSIGYGVAKEHDTCNSLMQRIDNYLYHVKNSGRDAFHSSDH